MQNRMRMEVKVITVMDIGPDELKEKQKADPTLKNYWELADKPSDTNKQQFITKKGILYRKYSGKNNRENLIHLVVPSELRSKVVSLAHDTLSARHRGASLSYISLLIINKCFYLYMNVHYLRNRR